jgi:hypothetical protein
MLAPARGIGDAHGIARPSSRSSASAKARSPPSRARRERPCAHRCAARASIEQTCAARWARACDVGPRARGRARRVARRRVGRERHAGDP